MDRFTMGNQGSIESARAEPREQAAQAILSDSPTGSVTGTTARTFKSAVRSASGTFDRAIGTARQTAITAPTAGSTSSARTFVLADGSARTGDTSAINRALSTAIGSYNQGVP